MKTDKKGCSNCGMGEEHYETFPHPTMKNKTFVQYDYRHTTGELFTTVAPTIETCRERRDLWIESL